MYQPTDELILASSSSYRATALRTLGLDFHQIDPDIDETSQPGESPPGLVWRLAREKACKIRSHYPHAWIIAGDQVGVCGDEILTKPGHFEAAVDQLDRMQGQPLVFYSGLAVASPHALACTIVPTFMRMRPLSRSQIEHYVQADQPIDCAGSFKVESRGIALFHSIQSRDPSALIGLPLISLCSMLQRLA